MKWFGEAARRLQMLLQRRRFDAELGEEMRLHVELREMENLGTGMNAAEARSAANRRFGNTTYLREESRKAWGWSWVENIAQDTRYGVRALLRERGVSAVCVLILALGIGASTALYSVWKSALVFPFEFQRNGRWVAILAGFNRQQTRSWFFSVPEYKDLQRLNDVFEGFAIMQHVMANLTDNGHPESLDITAVSADAIGHTGVQPMLGRSFLAGEDVPGGPNVAVIGYDLWHSRYQNDRNIIGREIRMNDENYTVIGVMPPYYRLWGTLVWVPLRIDYNESNRSHRAYWVTAMLKEGVSKKQADAKLAVVAHEWEHQHGGQAPEYASLRLWTEDVMKYVTSSMRDAMLILIVAIALLLVITCANVTNILLARIAGRRREVAIRLAIGGSRGRITCQFLTESIVLATASGLLGLLVAYESLPLIRRHVIDYVSTEAPEFKFDGYAFLLVIAFSMAVGLTYGIGPAIQASRTALNEALKEGGRGGAARRGNWWRKTLVVAQVGLALAVVAAAGLMTQSYRRLSNSNLGFNPAHLLETEITLPENSYPGIGQAFSFFQALQQSVDQIPRVEAAGVVSSLPMVDRLDRRDFHVEGRAPNASDAAGGAAVRYATAGYFRAMQVSLMKGRLLTDNDRGGRQLVAVVNETLAQRFWPKESAIGKQIALGNQYSERMVSSEAARPWGLAAAQWLTIVGVIHDVRQAQEWGVAILPEIYLPLGQSAAPLRGARLVVRSKQGSGELLGALREVVARLDSSLPLGDTQTINKIVGDAYGTERLALVLLTIFAVVAVVLASAGVYALLSYNVSQQAREIGIRMALGALPRQVLGLVLGSGVRLAMSGVAVGMAAGILVTLLMRRLLYQVNAANPLIFAGAGGALLIFALVACYVPARRAMRVDPLVALQYE